jgi:hypothetical protein
MSDTIGDPLVKGVRAHFHWSPVIAGALAAAALGFVLHAFAIAIGLSASSAAPTWRDTSFALVLLSGLYLLLAAIVSYGFGGYVAGRLRARIAAAPSEDVEFRDGVHGLIVWALATLLTGVVVLWTLQPLSRPAQPSAAGAANSVAGENLIAFDLDRLFRGDRRPAGDIAYARAEAARILLTTASHSGMQGDDRAYLARLVAVTTGLPPADADQRVLVVAGNAKTDIDRARRSGVLLGFMSGAAALLGAAMAWFAAVSGGRHRDGHDAIPSYMDWGRPYTRSR